MKQITAFLLLIAFAGLLYLSEKGITSYQNQGRINTSFYQDGILKSEYNKVDRKANYNIEVEFNPASKSIVVNEEIIWINKTNSNTSEIQFHLYANAYKSNNTLFAKAYSLSPDAQTQIDIKSFRVNGEESQLIYFQPEIANPYDSTVAKVLLNKTIESGDSVRINF